MQPLEPSEEEAAHMAEQDGLAKWEGFDVQLGDLA
jgi:hypothetical protein